MSNIDHTKIYHPEKSVILTDDIGEGCRIHAPVWIGRKVKIGDNVRVQAMSFIPDGVTIEDEVFIGPGVIFTNDKHPPSEEWATTLVEREASIGANATILPGVKIGRCAMVGAGAVVTEDVQPYAVVVGNPAKFLSWRKK